MTGTIEKEIFKISICKAHRKQMCRECQMILNDLMHKTCPRGKKPESVIKAWRKTINDKSKELFLCIEVAASKAQDEEIERLRNEHCYCKKCGHSLYVADDNGYTHFVDPCPNCKKDKRIKDLEAKKGIKLGEVKR